MAAKYIVTFVRKEFCQVEVEANDAVVAENIAFEEIVADNVEWTKEGETECLDVELKEPETI